MGDKMGKGNVGAELIFVNGTLTLLSPDRKQAHSDTHIYGGIFFPAKSMRDMTALREGILPPPIFPYAGSEITKIWKFMCAGGGGGRRGYPFLFP